MQYLEGPIRISTKGVGYFQPGPKAGAIEIEPVFLNTALPGDIVKILVHPETKEEKLTGEVIEIVQRKKMEFVGVLERENGFYFLVPDDKRVYKDILIAPERLAGSQEGDKVLVEITEWTDPKKDPIGRVLVVIGRPGEHQTEMAAIVYEKGFRPSFPPIVEKEAEQIKAGATEDIKKEIKNRRDFRKILTFTIDPVDAKDFDDAISYQELEGGKIEVGVHIADVAHYVRPDTELDKEAVKRATSIYLVDRTVPMLPNVLSDDLCSLNEGEDKLTFSAVFTFDRNFKIIDEWFGRTVIHSHKRFTYEEAQEILDTKKGEHAAEINKLNEIARKLRQEKFAAGAISFEKDEIKFVLDEGGRPLKVIRKVRTDSHLLVEDLMLLANRKVAEFVSRIVENADKKFVYRVHDEPDRDKIKQLADFIAPFGHKLKIEDDTVSAKSINQLLKSAEGTPEENVINTVAMRSMAKAVYSTKNIGHYGLSFAHYAHFTSPIRRYPDVMVHRLLDYYLRGKEPSPEMLKRYDELTYHCSQMELNAQEAERDSVRYKQVEYMQNKIGEVFDGVISGLAKWGIYIEEEETLAEGMVKLFDLTDDFYIFDEKNYCMVGKNTGRRYRLGDRVRVKVLRADLKERAIDFAFV